MTPFPNHTITHTKTHPSHRNMLASLMLEGLSRYVRRLGLLTRGSTRVHAFPCASAHSGSCADSLPAYSGGTVMAFHHLPRPRRVLCVTPSICRSAVP